MERQSGSDIENDIGQGGFGNFILGDGTTRLVLMIVSRINANSVCHFQHPVEHDQYKDPTLEFLKLCNKVKGDLKLKQMTLPNNLEVVSGCLSLVDVKMDGKTITAPSKIGTHTCKSGGVSEIKNNENLCGDAVTTMMDYFTDADRPSVIIELHSSCSK